jgi:two-component system chemotaxis sensor kinase CheA
MITDQGKSGGRISLRWKINLIGIFIIFMFTITHFVLLLPQLEREKYAERKGKLKATVDAFVSLMDHYEKAVRSEQWKTDPTMPRTVEEAKSRVLRDLRQVRYDKTEFFFILDGNGNMVMHPLKGELDGKNVMNVTDPQGRKVFRDMTLLSQRDGEAHVSYLWEAKYSPIIHEPQVAYAKQYWPWDWVVCSSLYTQDIVDSVRQLTWKTVAFDVLGSAIGMLFLFLVGGAVSRREEKQRERIEQRTRELDERNQAMRLVLDNVEQGFLTIDREGVVAEERSGVVEKWLGPCPPGTKWGDYLKPIAPDTATLFTLGWESVLEGFLPLELCIDQLPRRMTVLRRHYEFSYRPIFHTTGTGEQVLINCLVVITDITVEIERERMEAEQRETMNLFERIVRDRAGVVEFAGESRRLVQIISTRMTDSIPEIKRVVHTLKGNSGIFGLSTVSSLCSDIEVEMHETENLPSSPLRGALVDRWSSVETKLEIWLGQQSNNRHIDIDDEDYRTVLRAIREGRPSQEIALQIESWSLEPMTKRLARIADQVRRLASRMGKGDVHVVAEPNRLRMDQEHWGTFWSSLIHVIRNAVDHGLETAEERKEAGKTTPPTIALRTFTADTEVVVEIEDNGRGIDWSAIAAKATKLGLPSASQDDLVRAIFADGLSTRDEVTEISGRGVGMSAVMLECQTRGGRVTVSSEPGVGSLFSFWFPLSELHRRAHVRLTSLRPSHMPQGMVLPIKIPQNPPVKVTISLSDGN